MKESAPNRQQISIPERELLEFVSAVSELFDPARSSFVREIWLDALATMETMPSPASSEWRLVTLAAWTRLAQHVIEVPIVTAADCSVAAQATFVQQAIPKY